MTTEPTPHDDQEDADRKPSLNDLDDLEDDNRATWTDPKVPKKGQGRNPYYSMLEQNIKQMTANAAQLIRASPEYHPNHPECEQNTEDLMCNDLGPEISEVTQSSLRYAKSTREALERENPELMSLDPIGEDSDDMVSEMIHDAVDNDVPPDELADDVFFERIYSRTMNEIYDAVHAVQNNERRIVVGIGPHTGIRLVGIVDVHEWNNAAGVFRIDTL